MSKKNGENDIYDIVAMNIKCYRKRKNLTQAQLAERAEYSHEFIRRIEAPNTTKNFSVDTINNIAKALDIDIALLFDEKIKDKEENSDAEKTTTK